VAQAVSPACVIWCVPKAILVPAGTSIMHSSI